MQNIVILIIIIFSAQFAVAQQSESASGSEPSNSEPSNERWYQVELLIYANYQQATADIELWEPQPDLHYPANSVRLIDPAEESHSHDTTSSLDKTVLQSPIIDRIELQEPAFTLLPNTELQLLSTAKKIASQRDFRLLFHGAWRQLISPRDQAKSIVLTGGDKFDDHYELEGTIKLGVERYLHIDTDLWLNTFTSNIGLSETPWQLLPKRPNPEPSVMEMKELAVEEGADRFYSSTNNSAPPSKAFERPKKITTDALTELFGNQFSVERTVTLRQKRRMRSNELHYLDHPLMGLLVKITQHDRIVLPVNDTSEQSETATAPSLEMQMDEDNLMSPTTDSAPTTQGSPPLRESFEP